MPDANKFEYLNLKTLSSRVIFERIKKLSGYDINVVVLLTKNEINKEKIYQEAHVDYLLKPLSPSKLDSLLKKYFLDE